MLEQWGKGCCSTEIVAPPPFHGFHCCVPRIELLALGDVAAVKRIPEFSSAIGPTMPATFAQYNHSLAAGDVAGIANSQLLYRDVQVSKFTRVSPYPLIPCGILPMAMINTSP